MWVLISLFSSGTRADASLSTCQQPDSMSGRLVKRGSFNINTPSMTLSQTYEELLKQGADQQHAFLKHMFQSMNTHVGKEGIGHVLKSQLGIVAAKIEQLSLDLMVDVTFLAMKSKSVRKSLDTFPTLTTTDMLHLQKIIMNAGHFKFLSAASVTAFDKRDIGITTLRTEGCTVDQFNPQPFFPGLPYVVKGGMPITDSMAPCSYQNSGPIADLLNQLTNTASRPPLTTPLQLTTDQSGAVIYPITNNVDFLNALGKMGYSLEISTTSSKVDFLGIGWNDSNGYQSIEAAVSIWDPHGKRRSTYHGEVNLMLIKDNLIQAKLSWFFAAPLTPAEQGSAAMWRGQTDKRAAWNDQQIGNIRVFAAADTGNSLPWFESMGDLMRGFRYVDQSLSPLSDGYGLFVCGDSLALLLEKLKRSSTDACYTTLTALVYPIVRGGGMNVPRALRRVDVTQMVIEAAGGIDRASLDRDYPSDL